MTLALALSRYRDAHCAHCGFLVSECRDDDLEDRWQVRVDTCHATAAIDRARSDSHGEPLPGQVVSVALLPPGEVASDPHSLPLEQARAEYARVLELRSRLPMQPEEVSRG